MSGMLPLDFRTVLFHILTSHTSSDKTPQQLTLTKQSPSSKFRERTTKESRHMTAEKQTKRDITGGMEAPRPLASTHRRTRANTRRDQLHFRTDMHPLRANTQRRTRAKARCDQLQLGIDMALILGGMMPQDHICRRIHCARLQPAIH